MVRHRKLADRTAVTGRGETAMEEAAAATDPDVVRCKISI